MTLDFLKCVSYSGATIELQMILEKVLGTNCGEWTELPAWLIATLHKSLENVRGTPLTHEYHLSSILGNISLQLRVFSHDTSFPQMCDLVGSKVVMLLIYGWFSRRF